MSVMYNVIGILLICCCNEALGQLAVTLVSDPAGPVYQAGTLLSFTCVVDTFAIPPIEYQWTLYCTESNDIVLTHLVSNNPYWPTDPILTTPNVCINEIFCGVIDSVNNTGYAGIYIDNIIGAGLTYDGAPIANNTSIVVQNGTYTNTIGCHSGSMSLNNGKWILPNGSELSQSNEVFVVNRNGAMVHSYVSLSVRQGIELLPSMLGIYQCVIIDMDGSEQVLSFQLTMDDLGSVPNLIRHEYFVSNTHDMLNLLCAFEYSYGSIVWYRNGVLVGPNNSITTSSLNTTAITHESVLTILGSAVAGEYQCSFVMHVLMLNGQKLISTVSHYFIVQPVGAHHMVHCHFDASIVSATEVLRNGHLWIVKQNSNMAQINFQPIQDSDQGHLYSCIGEGASGLVYLNFTVIVTVNTIPLSISLVQPPVLMAGEAAQLTCTVQKVVPGYSSLPELNWYSNLNDFTINDSFNVSSTILPNEIVRSVASIASLPTSLAGSYTCIANLFTPALQLDLNIFLTVTDDHPLRIILPLSGVVVTGSSDVVYVGGSATFTCTANANSAIDTPIRADISWYSGHRSNLLNPRDNHVTIETASVSNLQHVSNLTIAPVSHFVVEGVGCIVVLYPSDDQSPFIEPSAVEHIDATVTVADPDIVLTVLQQSINLPGTSPYNSFPLTCIIEEPNDLQVQSSINWMRGGTVLDISNGYRVNETSISPTQRHLVLYIENAAPENYSFRCVSNLTVPGDPPIIHSATVDVEIRGSTAPVLPQGLSVVSKHAQEVSISWIVPAVSYVQEIYTIEYGLSPDELVLTSTHMFGNINITLQNQLYSLPLVGLQDNTTYYYKIIADNSFFQTKTATHYFTTPPLSLSIEFQATVGDVIIGGTEHSLGCVVSLMDNALFPPNVTLYRPDGMPASNDSNSLVRYINNVSNSTVVVMLDITTHTSHAGRYRCEAVLANGEQVDVMEYLVVGIPIPTLTLAVSPSPFADAGIYEGHNVMLSCQIELSGYIDTPISINGTWKLNGQVIETSKKIKIEPFNSGSTSILSLDEIELGSMGEYVCDVMVSKGAAATSLAGMTYIIPARATINVTVPIKELPSHNVTTVTSSSLLTAGQPLNLTCMVSASDPLLQLPDVHWSGPTGQVQAIDAVLTGPKTIGAVVHLSLYLSAVRASQAGEYICHAVSNITTLALIKETASTQQVSITIPSPELHIQYTPSSGGQYHAGSALNMTCVTVLSQAVDIEVSLISYWEAPVVFSANSTRVMEHKPVLETARTYHSVLQFLTLSRSGDSGSYNCSVAVVPVGSPMVIQSSFTTTHTAIDVASPPFSLSIYPLTPHLLGITPYNTLMVQCIADTPNDVLSSKQFVWRIISEDSQTLGMILHNNTEGFTIHQTDHVGNKTSVSHLEGVLKVVGSYRVTCDAVLDITGDSYQPSSNLEVNVTVKASSLPDRATNITAARGIAVDSAVISWSVAQLAYTPEHYIIKYGTEYNTLTTSTQSVSSGNNIYLTDATYKQDITDLSIGGTYYCQIVSSNSEGTVSSDIISFVAGFESALFQLKLAGINRCIDWVFIDANSKKQDVVAAVSEAIQEVCACHVPMNHIQEGQFLCMDDEPDRVLFRARVYRTQEHSAQNLVQSLQEWTVRAPTVVVASTRLQVDSSCITTINTFSDPNCQQQVSYNSQQGLSTTVYIVIGVVCCLLVAIAVVILCLCLLCCYSHKARKKEEEEMRMREIAMHSAISQPITPSATPQHSEIFREKFDAYMSPTPSTFSHNSPPHYLSPSKSTGFTEKPMVPTGYSIPSAAQPGRNSHIYYTNTPPRVNPSKSSDPIYEPIPGDMPMDCQSKPRIPERLSLRKGSSISQDCDAGHRETQLGRVHNYRSQSTGHDDRIQRNMHEDEQEEDQYEYMQSVGSINILGTL